jgi:hypothetical protein
MPDAGAELVVVEVAAWRAMTSPGPPAALADYRQHADLHEQFDDQKSREARGFFFVAVTRAAEEWPSLVITQTFSPSEGGFSPGVLIVPETDIVFIGAGTRLLCYQLASGRWSRRWQDQADVGFWGWRRHSDVVVMSAEIELAAWTIDGLKLWRTFVEPPWSYEVEDGTLRLDLVGTISSFPLEAGPAAR